MPPFPLPLLAEGGGPAAATPSGEPVPEATPSDPATHEAAKMAAVTTATAAIALPCIRALRLIRGRLDSLDAAVDPGVIRARLQDAATEIDRTLDLLGRALRMAYPRPGRVEPVEVRLLVENVLPSVRAGIPATVRLLTRYQHRGDRVLADPVQIREVLLHLAVNATEAMPDGGTLQFQTGRADVAGVPLSTTGSHGFAWIEVRDTGRGIPPDLLPRVCEPFVTTKTSEGSGLGLAILYNVLREHGGGVTIESTPGIGTAVRMFLPRTPVPSGHPGRAASSPFLLDRPGSSASFE